MRARGDLAKVAVFVLVTGLMLAAVGVAIGGFRFQDSATYTAEFTDVSGLTAGSEVRAAGVTIGAVDDVELLPESTVKVRFSVPTTLSLTRHTTATIRYKNLLGDRFLSLADGSGPADALPEDGHIPLTRTAPALNLDELFNGFKPLLQALSPKEVNELSASLIAVFQGEGHTVDALLADLGSLTNTLADKDAVIGRVIDNLNTVLGTVDDRRAQFSDLIENLQRVVGRLAADRTKLGRSLSKIDALAGTTTTFLRKVRPELAGTVRQTGRLAAAFNLEADKADYYLRQIPKVIQLTGRGGAYGSFFNFYLCGLALKLDGPAGPITTPMLRADIPRCREGAK